MSSADSVSVVVRVEFFKHLIDGGVTSIRVQAHQQALVATEQVLIPNEVHVLIGWVLPVNHLEPIFVLSGVLVVLGRDDPDFDCAAIEGDAASLSLAI
jgi:hypothetical protein